MDRQTARFSNIRSKVLLGLLAATCLVVAPPVRADDSRDEGEHDNRRDRDGSKTHIAVDFDFNSAIDQPETEAGGGGALRLGQELDLFLISLTPELGGGYHAFGSGGDRSKLYSGFLGGRLAIGKVIEPSLFAHVGVGRLNGPETRTAAIFDGGLAIDFTLLPLIDLGLHGAYNVMLPRDEGTSFKFVTLGAQAALVL